jgi:hypothetical protein
MKPRITRVKRTKDLWLVKDANQGCITGSFAAACVLAKSWLNQLKG